MIIFDGQEVVINYHEGNSDYIFITFNSLGTNNHENKESYFLKPIAEKYNFACLGIITKINNYYLHPEIQEVINLCNNITKNYKKIIITGLSMGGYGALKYSKALNADIVFPMSARCTIDIKQQPLYGAEVEIASKLPPEVVKNSTIKTDDVGGKVFLVYDPLSPPNNLDIEHLTHLRQELPRATFLPTHFTNHMVIFHLQGSMVFKSIIDALVAGDEDNIVKTVISVRRHHIKNIIAKSEQFSKKYPYLIYKMLTGPTFAKVKDNHLILDNYKLRLQLCYLLNVQGFQKESSDYLKAIFFYHTQNIPHDQYKEQNGLNPYPYLINYHGYFLCYNFVTKKLNSIVSIGEKPYCLPLQLYKEHGKIKLITIHNGVIFKLTYDDDDDFSFNLSLLSDEKNDNLVKLSYANYNIFMHLKHKKHYINIVPGHGIGSGPKPSTSESFTAISMISPEQMIL